MPASFLDMNSLKRAAKVHRFREPAKDELEMVYRRFLHEHVKPIDRVESYEILFKHGWDQWTDRENEQALFG